MKLNILITTVILTAMCMVQAEPVPQEILDAVNDVAVANGLHPRKPHYLLEQFVPAATGDEEQRKQLAHALLKAFTSEKTTSEGRTIIAQHLGEVAGDAEIDALKKIQGNAQTMADVRIALNELAASSIKDEGKAAYLTEIKSDKADKVIAGLAAMAKFHPEDAGEISLQYINSEDKQVNATAMRIYAGKYPAGFAKLLPTMTREKQITALTVVRQMHIAEAVTVVEKLAASEDQEIRYAALSALGSIGDRKCVETLAAAGAVDALITLNAKGVDKAIAETINKGGQTSRITALEAAVKRGIGNLEPALLTAAQGDDGEIASEALKVLGRNGDLSIYPELVGLLGGRHSEEAVIAVRRMIKRMDNLESSINPLAKVIKKGNLVEKIAAVKCLSAIENNDALAIIATNINAQEDDIADAALRALAQWNDAAAIPLMKKVAVDKKYSVIHRTLCERALKSFEANGARLSALAYLNCGVETSVKGKAGIQLVLTKGKPWKYTDEPAGLVAFENSEVVVDIKGLKPDRKYILGFVWWDYDNNGREQSVQIGEMSVLPKTALPAWKGRNEPAVSVNVNIPASEIKEGKTTVRFKREGKCNCVVSEVWVSEGETDIAFKPVPVVLTAPAKKTVPESPPDPKHFGPPVVKANKGAVKKILLVTGNEYPGHRWRETAPEIVKFLTEDQRLEISYTEDYTILSDKLIFSYDAVFLNYQNHNEPGPAGGVDNLSKYVNGGGGLVLFHFACGAFISGYPEQTYNPEFMRVAGRSWNPALRGHDPFGKFTVNIADENHPVTKGLKDFEQEDELYTCLDGDTPIQVLASAISKVDKKVYPMAFTATPGKGRVFNCVLGHNLKAFNPSMKELYRRGTAWTAGL